MGILDTLFGTNVPTYTPPPQYQQAPQYQVDPQGQTQVNNLQNILAQNYQRLSSGGSALPQNYVDNQMNVATTAANQAANQGSNRIAEQLNLNGLLGSTAQGTALGYNEQERQNQIGQARNAVTSADFGAQQNMYNSTLGASQGLINSLQKQSDAKLGAQQYGTSQANDQSYKQYQSQLEANQSQAKRLQGILSFVPSLATAAKTAGMFA